MTADRINIALTHEAFDALLEMARTFVHSDLPFAADNLHGDELVEYAAREGSVEAIRARRPGARSPDGSPVVWDETPEDVAEYIAAHAAVYRELWNARQEVAS